MTSWLSGQAEDFYRHLREHIAGWRGVAGRWRVNGSPTAGVSGGCAIAEVRGGLEDISYAHLEDIRRLSPGQQVHLPGVRVLHEAGRTGISSRAAEGGRSRSGIPEEALRMPGTHCLPDSPIAACAWRNIDGPLPIEAGDVAVLDAGAVRGPLCVRSWQPGDRYRPFGAPGTRKLQDIFVDAGVPRRLRDAGSGGVG